MKGKITLIFLMRCVCCSFLVVAQDLKVSGKVTDEKGESLPGVSIKIKNATGGTQTGVNGDYSITVSSENQILVFSYLGFTTQELLVGNRRTINVSLAVSSATLNEVVVIGYGTQKVTKISGAISTVKGSDIEKL